MTAVYTFIAEEQADPACDWSVCEMCRVLEVSRSGFYDWQTRGPSARELEDRVLAREIELPAVPRSLADYLTFCERTIEFLMARNARIRQLGL